MSNGPLSIEYKKKVSIGLKISWVLKNGRTVEEIKNRGLDAIYAEVQAQKRDAENALRRNRRKFPLNPLYSPKKSRGTWEQQYGKEKAEKMKIEQSAIAKIQMSYRIGKTLEEIHGKEKGEQIKGALLKGAYGVSQRIKGKNYEEIYGEKAGERRKASAAKNPIRGTFEERYGEERASKIKLKISMAQIGKKSQPRGSLESQYGKERAQEIKRKISYTLRLKNTDKPRMADIIKSEKYRAWRKAVFERDDYTCQECLVRGGYLHAHHIKPKTLFPELMFDIDNGITYCKKCHFRDKHKGIPKVNNRKLKNV